MIRIVFYFGLMVLVAGVIFLGLQALLVKKFRRLKEVCTSRTIATVTEMERKTHVDMDGNMQDTWYPHYRYYVNGELIQTTGQNGVMKNKFHEGQQIMLNYNPKQIHEIYVEEENVNLLLLILRIVGIFLLVIGVILFILAFVL